MSIYVYLGFNISSTWTEHALSHPLNPRDTPVKREHCQCEKQRYCPSFRPLICARLLPRSDTTVFSSALKLTRERRTHTHTKSINSVIRRQITLVKCIFLSVMGRSTFYRLFILDKENHDVSVLYVQCPTEDCAIHCMRHLLHVPGFCSVLIYCFWGISSSPFWGLFKSNRDYCWLFLF